MLDADPIDWTDPDHPRSTRYGDLFAPRAGALQQAEAVFLRGNGLPERWRRRERFVVLETGFGLGNNLLATWAAWRADPQRPKRLFFLSLDAHPVTREDLARAHAHSPLGDLAERLRQQWPPRVPGLHRLDLDEGLQLLLQFGDVQESLGEFQAEVDAFYLDGFAPRLNPAMWSREALAPLTRLAAPGASVATWSAAVGVHEALGAAGFSCRRVPGWGDKAEITVAQFAPRHRTSEPAGLRALAPHTQEAVVLGAGLAGATCARALHEAGLQVRVVEALGAPQRTTAGNGGLFHATVHADDGPHARWSRAAALRGRQWLRRHPPPWLADGLLRLAEEPQAERAALAARLGLDAEFVEARAEGWFYPGGGALPPRDWTARLLDGLALQCDTPVATLQPLDAGRWVLRDAGGGVIAETGLLVLAAGAALPNLLSTLGDPDHELTASLRAQRGQVSLWSGPLPGPAQPTASGGYVLALPSGGLAAGSTASFDDDEASVRAADQARNHALAERLMGRRLPPPDDGRVGWRLLAADKLPLVGGLIDPHQAPPRRPTQPAHWARRPGLALCGAFASRGITWAPLAADLVVAQVLGWPLPVSRSLQAAVDPARQQVRALRHRDPADARGSAPAGLSA